MKKPITGPEKPSPTHRKDKRLDATISLRLPSPMLEEIRKLARSEYHSVNTQMLLLFARALDRPDLLP